MDFRYPFARIMACAVLAMLALHGSARADDDAADQLARSLRERFGSSYEILRDPGRRIVYATALDQHHFGQIVELLAFTSDAFCGQMDTRPPQWPIAVILPTAEDYEHMRPDKNVIGFYRPSRRELIAIDRGQVLLHEFIHALHHADMAAERQVHPVWICEGLATLFDASRPKGRRLAPAFDSRLLALQRAIRRDEMIPLRRLMQMDRSTFQDQAKTTYPLARYLMLYLHEKGKLAEWYAAYKRGYDDDSTGRKAFEATLGRRLWQIEKDFMKWVEGLEMTRGERSAGRARLGIRVQQTSGGVKVMGFLPGSAAERAERVQVGDQILEFAGHEVSNVGEFVGAVQAAGADQTVKIRLRRHGRILTVRQPLGGSRPLKVRPTDRQ